MIEVIFLSYNKIQGLSNSTCISLLLVIKYGDKYLLSNCIPSTISSLVSPVWDSSTVTTPSSHSGGGTFSTVYENFTEIVYYITGDDSVSIAPSEVKASAEL